MSIILDALKKAEKDRVTPENDGGMAKTATIIDDAKKSGSPFSVRPVVLLLLVLASALIYAGVKWGPIVLSQVKSILPVSKVTAIPAVAPKPKKVDTIVPTEEQKSAAKKKFEETKAEALAYFEAGDFEKSVDAYLELAEEVQDDPEVYNNMGVAYKKLDKVKEARNSYEKALDINPDYPEALNNMAVIDIELYNHESAKEKLLAAVNLDAKYAEPHFHLASIYEHEGQLENAIKHYEDFVKNSIHIDPELKRKIDLRLDILKAKLAREGS